MDAPFTFPRSAPGSYRIMLNGQQVGYINRGLQTYGSVPHPWHLTLFGRRLLQRSLREAQAYVIEHGALPDWAHGVCTDCQGSTEDVDIRLCDECKKREAAKEKAGEVSDDQWSTEDFISWGQYLIAAIECDWEDVDSVIAQFTSKYGRRDSAAFGDLDGYDYPGRDD